jgi:hypothetical protein
MVIWVPPGMKDDRSMSTDEMDLVTKVLLASGAKLLPTLI